jgi:hypothetical protein
MSRSSMTIPLLLVVGAALAACSDRSPSAPRPIAGREVTFDRESAEPTRGIVVAGTGDPSVDVPAVQAAVDRGGVVILEGHFSFNASATKALASPLVSSGIYPPTAEVLISKAVTISGVSNERGEMTTIDAGTIPFYIEAPGASVTIHRLRFVQPTSDAILVYAVSGLEVASSKIEGVVPYLGGDEGIGVNTSGAPPTLAKPGHPENVSGTVRIVDNDIDMIAPTAANTPITVGVVMFSLGVPGAEIDAHIAGNEIRNTTEPAINFRQIAGRAAIEHNRIATGPVVGQAPRPQAIRVVNTGTYRIAHNYIKCEWATTDAQGIGVFSQFATWPIEHAVVVDNDIDMSAPAGTKFGAFSAGIAVYGFAQTNIVRHNTIHGAALAALSIPAVFPLPPQAPATPQDNAFIRNRFVEFMPSDADIFVGDHALRTRIAGPGTVDDRGTGTIIVRRASENGAEGNDHAP